MLQLFEFLEQYSDYVIIGILLLMSVIMLTAVIERFLFLKSVNVAKYSNIHALEIDLNRNMTVISTVGGGAHPNNAPRGRTWSGSSLPSSKEMGYYSARIWISEPEA